MSDRDNETDTLKNYLEGAKAGEFWIGSTSQGDSEPNFPNPSNHAKLIQTTRN